ncbi:VOC family protein [Thalassospira marina]|uniref:Glyoxalase/bleomycin resistance/extradiol dioxygenase family protein n=1 Tax=Thalassospira marina TaxID=2048283 RepID=A0A2N3KZY6_9PROT|nr:VOC family protein [Thalassospira marina]PKR56103.1 glyoxalase/bleomycin resistance/extradiol dioxygenase family protein [Thalassospira marina]
MIDHLGIAVTDHAKARDFYLSVLAPLEISIVMEVSAEQTGDQAHTGFGNQAKPFFWITGGKKVAAPGTHIAFGAQSRGAVDAFYRAALSAGAKDNGAPGLRPHFHENYYGAFIIDADGNNIEAVCHTPAA